MDFALQRSQILKTSPAPFLISSYHVKSTIRLWLVNAEILHQLVLGELLVIMYAEFHFC